MIGLGTIINVIAIIAGGILGTFGKKLLSASMQDGLLKANGLAVIFLGISGALKEIFVLENNQLSTQGTLMMIVSLAVGTIIGEAFHFEEKFESFGTWLKKKTGNQEDDSFLNAFLTATFTVCIGAMAIVGAIQDGLNQGYETLLLKGLLDFIIIMVMASSLGKGCIFSFIPVAIFQGLITLLAQVISPIMTTQAISNLSLVGNILITCVGINLIWPKTIKVVNMLPAVLVAVIYAFFQ